MYNLLRQGFDGEPMAKKAIIVTPTSLVSNWESEIKKWFVDRLQLIALCESTRDDVVSGIDSFIRLRSPYQALAGLSCNRRILLLGTPMQNDLEEVFAMVNFTNPGILGDAAYFRRYYESSIISRREPTATEEERNLSVERSAELSKKVNQFILRRTNALLSNHLPPKVKRAISEKAKQSKILAYITALKKLCNHPKIGYQWRLIYDTIKSGSGTSGFEDLRIAFDFFLLQCVLEDACLARLLAQLRRKTDDRIVLVSNYT
ncbi:hypothetical protein MKW92_029533 [Papaver armeniacum]|nr:hypothetical protein MKW92_029533 [Papaver armeniacum]